MKNIRIFISLCLGITNGTYAQNNQQQVSLSEAMQVALNRISNGQYVQATYQKKDNTGNTILYEIVTDTTTLLLSGSKACKPILGEYNSSSGSLIEQYDNLPCGLRFFVDCYITQIEKCFHDGVDRNYHQETWDSLINGVEIQNRFLAVEPLIYTRWKQKGCNMGYGVGYEYYIPGISNECDHCKAGCGPVAMGQVMKYWNYPVVQLGRVEQFDWCNMSMDLVTYLNTFIKNRDAIGKLLADCWYKTVEFPTCDRSYSSMSSTRDALVDAYNYDSHARLVNRNGYSGNWDEMLIDQLNNGRPVIYGGKGAYGAHTFICCGVNQNGRFYMNWGNGGEYDGYFETNNLHYYDTSFTDAQQAIINIYPATNDDVCNIPMSLDLYYGIFYYLPGHSNYHPHEIVPQTMTSLTSASISSPQAWRTIPDSVSAVYQAHEEIILQDGFEAELGCEFEARIEPCEQCEELRENGLNETNGTADIEDNGNDGDVLYSTGMPAESVSIDLFPNPTDGPLTMPVDDEVLEILVFTLDGRPVGGWHLTARTKTAVTLDVSPLAPAAYLLSVRTTTTLHTARFIKQ